MGSSAYYNAGVNIITKRTLKIDQPNSEEDIQKFLKKKGGSFNKPVALKDQEEPTEEKLTDGTYTGYMFVGQTDWDDEDRNILSTEFETLEDFLEAYKECLIEEAVILGLKPMTVKELSKVNLTILKEYDILQKNIDSIESVGYDGGDIYCDNDNSFSDKLKLTNKQLEDLLAKRAYLEFYGDGNAYC